MDELLEARVSDMYSQCARNYSPVYSAFLDERQCALSELYCRDDGELFHKFWGGYDDAQRKILCVYPDFSEDCVISDCPIRCLTFTFRKEDKLSHRDFLGSFMALCLKREVIGDIIIAEGIAQAFVTDVAARLILGTISKIGRVGVKISDEMPFSLENNQEYETIGGTVASPRLDCIVSLAAKVSRENAARLIRSEKTAVNHLTAKSVSSELKEGDVISIRGYGKFIFESVNGTTKKGRKHIILRKYK
jgi:RNA-binding protein YlmH